MPPLDIEQPEDRGILLRDILETVTNEKGYILKPAGKPLTEREMDYMVRETSGGRNHFDFDYHHDSTKDKGSCVTANTHRGVPYNVCAECINPLPSEKSRTVDAHMKNLEHCLIPRVNNPNPAKQQYDCIVEPVRIGTIDSDTKHPEHDSQQYRVYSPDGKSVTLCGAGGVLEQRPDCTQSGLMDGQPVNTTAEGKAQCLRATYYKDGIRNMVGNNVDRKTCVAEPVQVGIYPNGKGELTRCQSKRIYSVDSKGRMLQAGLGGLGVQTGLYAIPQEYMIETEDGKTYPIYEVKGGYITIKGKQYPIKLADGWYIIRKLTVTECKRLQTVPESYVFPVSDSQAYKMLGNGWTVEVIAHILSHIPEIGTEPLEVLSMYDGMSCGHIALDRLGAEVAAYYATEIDKYAIQTTQHNYPDTVQLGDAFQVREDGWRLPEEL